MKRRGFLLIYVVLLLAFIGVIAFYSMERMRLAILVEENRVDTIRGRAQQEEKIAYLLEAENQETILTLCKTHLSGPAGETKDYDIMLVAGDGTDAHANVEIDTQNQRLIWHFPGIAHEGTFIAVQDLTTPLDQTEREDGLPLDTKMAWLKQNLYESNLPVIITDSDILIRLARDKLHWEVYEIHKKAEEPTDPSTEEPASEEADTEESTGEEGETTENAPVETETDTEPETEEKLIHTFSVSDQIYMIVQGNMRMEALNISEKAPLFGTILIDGNLELKKTELKGIVLQRGDIAISKKSKINGYYESDRTFDLENTDYTRANPRKLIAGMHIPGFLSLHTRGLVSPPPDDL